ncbi:MAG TPA: thioredoxin family protein [Acidimicrobiia bacterium]|nr:thioredoxin family protein [Acidimicrobiia bacterium]
MSDATATLPDGLVAIVKRDCPTCALIVPVLEQLATGPGITVFTQDDPSFPEGLDPIDDTDLEVSFTLELDTVPTLLHVVDGRETDRIVGWSREQWEAFTGRDDLGEDLPPHRPGCGSRTQDPDLAAARAATAGAARLTSRRVELGAAEDQLEAMYERGWSDGLPLVPPTPERVARMLAGTTRDPSSVVATVPPDLVECTVEKVAINAVMAGCRPEYLPVVLAAVEAACTDAFNIHGVLATTMPVGPVVVVNGPVARAIGMNSGGNALGQGNRANATIGRALQLVIRNVGGGRPGGVDRATQGQPGKYTFCFAEDETGSPWEPLHVARGFEPGQSTVTLFTGEGPRVVLDQLSRTPESLTATFAACLRTVAHPKIVLGIDAMLVVSPEHARVYREAGWDRSRLMDALAAALQVPGEEFVRGAGGITEGMPEAFADNPLPKFRDGGLLVVHVGGKAGLFSAIIGGWLGGGGGSDPVTVAVGT